jgi:uncharacterized damage-inducible protein DinB
MVGMATGLLETVRHNTWANVRLIDVCTGLTDSQLDTPAEGTYGTIRDTLIHILGAEESYLHRVTGERPEPPLQEGEWPGFDVLRTRAEEAGSRFERVVTGDDTERVVRWRTRAGEDAAMPVGLFLVQSIHHGNEHRSQVATVLTHVGIEPPELSGWLYAIETGALSGITA